jgi:hypothetical protein
MTKLTDILKKVLGNTSYHENSIYPKNLHEAFRLNGFSVDKRNGKLYETTYYNIKGESVLLEDNDKETFSDKGGIISFSTDVNAVQSSKNKVLNFIKNKVATYKNRFMKNAKIYKVLNRHSEIYGVTIGNFVKGRYKDKDGNFYNEKSLSIEIIGITTEVLDAVAKDLTKEFTQESVLVKNYATNDIYLIYK